MMMSEPSFDHDRPDPLRPDEWEYQCVMPDGTTALISKVGGGTLGHSYEGAWHYSLTRRDRHLIGSDLFTGTAHTHWDALGIAYDYFIEED